MPSQNRSKVPIGTVLEGKFRLTQEIGRGGMAAVYEAENVDIGKRIAVKILADELISSRVVRERFIREARAAASIRSPYICEVYDSGMYDERPFLVMELLEGESLYDRMTRVRQMKIETTLKISTQVARGLQKAHEAGIVHRDLKPENIFITRDEEGRLLAKIVDFGLAKFYEAEGEEKNVRLTREGALFGTPAYMSPEQAKGQGEVDHRADLWALGCIVYECLTGQTVWNVEQGVAMILAQIAGAPIPKPSKLRPDLPSSFDEWFGRALNRDPEARFQTAKAFADSLSRALSPDTRPGRPPVASEIEGSVVDAMMAGRNLPMNPGVAAAQAAGALVPPEPQRTPTDTSSLPPPRSGSSAVGWLLVLSLVALGGYAVWLYVINPPSSQRSANASRPSPSGSGEPLVREPAETEPYAAEIGQAQALLSGGKPKEAVKAFEKATKTDGGKIIAQSLLAHTDVALDDQGDCSLMGISRPRPFDLTKPASHPTVFLGPQGPLVSWTDSHQDFRRRQGYVALLDDQLRRVTPTRNFTPEASSALYPELVDADGSVAAIYWDSGGKEPGVYVRMLHPDGRIATPARLLSKQRREKYYPTLTSLPGGGFLALWSEGRTGRGTSDLVARRLSRDLEPLEEAVQLTAVAKGEVSHPAATVVSGKLFVALRHGGAQADVRLLRIPLDAPALKSGVQVSDKDVFAGDSVLVHGPGQHSQPTLTCDDQGCLVVWDDEAAGAFAAFIPHDQKEPLWHREFAPDAIRPTVAEAPEAGAIVAFFADNRLRVAPITRDGVGRASVISRVSGFQPNPTVVPGRERGEWLLAWRDYEAGHLEVFVARAACGKGDTP